jgi:DNA-binding MarR family transcriptional regulator
MGTASRSSTDSVVAGVTSAEPDRPDGRDDEHGDELVVLLVRTAKVVVEQLRARRDPTTGPEIGVMHGLAAHHLLGRADVTTSSLARHLGVTKQSAAEIVTGLEDAGLVRRAPHPSDRRARVLLLTAAGRQRLARRRRDWEAVEAEWTEQVGADAVATVRHALTSYLDTHTG